MTLGTLRISRVARPRRALPRALKSPAAAQTVNLRSNQQHRRTRHLVQVYIISHCIDVKACPVASRAVQWLCRLLGWAGGAEWCRVCRVGHTCPESSALESIPSYSVGLGRIGCARVSAWRTALRACRPHVLILLCIDWNSIAALFLSWPRAVSFQLVICSLCNVCRIYRTFPLSGPVL